LLVYKQPGGGSVKIEMLNVGWFTAPAGVLRAGEPMDRKIRFPVPAYVIETDTERILIDTGLDPAAIADPGSHYERPDIFAVFTLEQERSIAEQIDLHLLTKVVLTHLHWDHVGALRLIPTSVPVVVQRTEWQAGHDGAAVARNGFLARDYAEHGREVVLVDGDHDLLGDGSVELLLTPGHTPGHQSIRVGELVLGADVAHFSSGLDDHRFPVFGDDREEQGRSADRLRAMRDRGFTVLPGHDPDVLRAGPLSV
jgi:glyoxylase-like metal-dependent hydrolase (beta-lactamase superfamily II)